MKQALLRIIYLLSNMAKQNKLVAVSLFSGAGGLDVGVEQAGFETIFATDFDDNCVSTLLRNQQKQIPLPKDAKRFYLQSAKIVKADVAELHLSDILDRQGKEVSRPTLLFGGPPCQPFSSSGKQRSVLDKRGRLFEHFVRIAEELSPEFVLFENVRGLVTARGPSGEPGEALNLVRAAFEDIGYGTRFELLNAADFGTPQRRVRLFMIAAKGRTPPEFPLPTHAEKPENTLFGSQDPWVTLGEFLDSQPPPTEDEIVGPSEKLAPLLAPLTPGSGLKSPGRKETTRPGGHWGYKQGTFIANPILPARTVTASSTQDWIKEYDGSLRRLSVRECAALQGFPFEWEFHGSKTSKFRQIGNAVPAVFGKVIGECLAREVNLPKKETLMKSAELPQHMINSISYTRRDHERNKSSRTRADYFLERSENAEIMV